MAAVADQELAHEVEFSLVKVCEEGWAASLLGVLKAASLNLNPEPMLEDIQAGKR